MANGHSSGCRICGKPTKRFARSGRHALYCADHLDRRITGQPQKRNPLKQVVCSVCGGSTGIRSRRQRSTRAFCGSECRAAARRYDQSQRELLRRYRNRCGTCGAEWVSGTRNAVMCKPCSARKAADAATDRHRADFVERHGSPSARTLGINREGLLLSRIYFARCEATDHPVVVRRKNGACQCVECEKIRTDRARGDGPQGPLRIETIPCKHCSEPMETLRGSGTRGSYATVCPACRAVRYREAKRRAGRRRKAWQRARKKDVHFTAVDRVRVFERDGWRCRLCGCSSPIELMGTLHDSAPELDHVVPLSKGGAHTEANTQLLCRLCNQIKSDRPMVAMVAWLAA